MKLERVLQDIQGYQVKGSKEIEITGISANSKLIVPGNLFIAKKGKSFDGKNYIKEAIQAGANVVVTDTFNPSVQEVVQVIHPDLQAIESTLVANYYHHPSQELFMVGITGTNGKTTTSSIIKNLLDHFFGKCGQIGTIEHIIGERRYQAKLTTPDIMTNHKLLREMIIEGCNSAIMEVSSHALDQGRVDNIDFDVAVFTNLTNNEHLDYHVSMENYGAAKKLLFSKLGKTKSQKRREKWAIVNRDTPWSSYMHEGCCANLLTYGINNLSDVQASDICFQEGGTWSKITYQGVSVDYFWPLIGRFNVYNCLAAIAVCLTQKIPFQDIASYMPKISFIPGRLQPIKNNLGLKIYVDFAHKPNALENVMLTLRELKEKSSRLFVVFGCGGDRDKSKRPQMAKICETYADFCIVTSDNPRTEDPNKICEEIIAGFTNHEICYVCLDRKKAIQLAISTAQPKDIILIAGKGHESYQIFHDHTIPFNDCEIAEKICAELYQESFLQ